MIVDTTKLTDDQLRLLQLFNSDATAAREKYTTQTTLQLVANLTVMTIHITVLQQIIQERSNNNVGDTTNTTKRD